jgi:hypothetical protein
VQYRVFVQKLNERDHLEDPGVDERIILKWTLKEEVRHELYCSGSGKGRVAGTSKCGNKPSGSITC